MTIEVKVEGLFIRPLLLHVIKNKTSKILLPLQVLIQGPRMMFNQSGVMASYGRNSVFIEAAQETPQVTENSTLELVTCGTTARGHSSRRPDTVGRDEMFSLSETELLELCISFPSIQK